MEKKPVSKIVDYYVRYFHTPLLVRQISSYLVKSKKTSNWPIIIDNFSFYTYRNHFIREKIIRKKVFYGVYVIPLTYFYKQLPNKLLLFFILGLLKDISPYTNLYKTM